MAPALKAVIETYVAKSGIALKPAYDAENLSSTMSLVGLDRRRHSIADLREDCCCRPTVVLRPLKGGAPTIELVMGYSRANTSPLLKRFLGGRIS